MFPTAVEAVNCIHFYMAGSPAYVWTTGSDASTSGSTPARQTPNSNDISLVMHAATAAAHSRDRQSAVPAATKLESSQLIVQTYHPTGRLH